MKLPNFTKILFFRGAYMFSLSPPKLIMIRWRFIFLCTFKNVSRKRHFSDCAFLACFCTSAILSQNRFFPNNFTKWGPFFLRYRYRKTTNVSLLDIIQPTWKKFFGEVGPTSDDSGSFVYIPGLILWFSEEYDHYCKTL